MSPGFVVSGWELPGSKCAEEGRGGEGKGREGKGREGKGREGKGRGGEGRALKFQVSHSDISIPLRKANRELHFSPDEK